MHIAVVVLAKTPGLTPAKTRLAKSIGVNAAETFYKLCLTATKDVIHTVQAQSVDKISHYWALAEANGPTHEYWQGDNVFWTGDGSFGERLHNVYSQLQKRYDLVILMGTDTPHLSSKALLDAVNRSKKSRYSPVIGPALDGGFYLFASGQTIQRRTWTQVTYSQSTTLGELLRNMGTAHIDTDKEKFRPVMLEPMMDIDTLENLKVLENILDSSALLEAQIHLCNWVGSLFKTKIKLS